MACQGGPANEVPLMNSIDAREQVFYHTWLSRIWRWFFWNTYPFWREAFNAEHQADYDHYYRYRRGAS
jgi:hypothetical protein